VIDGAADAKALNGETPCQEVIANRKEARQIWPHKLKVIHLPADALAERIGA
jgi:hypothetical protein